MRTACAVKNNVGVLVAIGTVVDDLEVVKLLICAWDGEGDLVSAFIESFDVAGAYLLVSGGCCTLMVEEKRASISSNSSGNCDTG